MAVPPFAARRASIIARISGPAAAPVGRLHLEAVVDPRVVARGDDDARRRTALDDLERAHLGRDGTDGIGDRDVVGGQDLGCGGSEMLGREPPVVRDHHALGRLAPADDVGRDSVGTAPDVLERVLIGDPRAPAIGTEDDSRGRGGLAGQGHLVSPPVPNSAR